MTTKVVDSTVSEILQHNSTVEYVEPQKNPIATVPTETKNLVSANPLFDFKAEHNGVQCIESLKPEDRGTERQYWFSVKFLYEAFEVADKTIRNKLERLEKLGEISNCNFLQLLLPDTCKPSTLYDLTVMNKLAMTLDCDKAIEVRKAFNDVLIKHETQAQPTIYDYARALIAEKERSDALEAQNKALTAERDEAIRTKYHFVEGRDAKVCGELGGLRTQNEALRKKIGDSKTYKAVTAITWRPDYFNMSNRGLYGSLAANLKKIEACMTSEFKHIDIPDSRFGKVKAYHVDVIERLHEMVQADENLMAKYRKITSV